MLEVEQLVKVYGSQRAVDNVSFVAQPGEILGFLGPNGAGKSTTMKIACGYLAPTEGTVKVAGLDVRTHSLDVRRRIGYLPEHNPLYLDMYVHEYLRFSGSIYGLKGAGLRRRVEEVVALTGLGLEQNKKIGALSKGYRQRVGLATALVHEPEVLILDEPTTGLDPNQLTEIRKLIQSIARDRTVVFSTHIMQEVQAICDRVVIINRGQIVANSPMSELMGGRKNLYVAEFETPVEAQILRAIPGVVSVKVLEPTRFELVGQEGADIRAQVFRTAADKGLTLLGLQARTESLESIFQELTRS